MSLTAQQLALRMAKHIGVTSLDPSDPSNANPTFNRGLQPGDIEELTACINAALQEIWMSAPTAVSHLRQSSVLPDPVTVTLDVTAGSKSLISFPAYASWMAGCTVVIEGGEEVNEVVDATQLRQPYRGVSGSVTAKVYPDCITLPAEVLALVEPVEYSKAGGLPYLLRLDLSYQNYQETSEAAQRRVGQPEVAYLETLFFPGAAPAQWRLRISPMPVEAGTLTYGTKLNVPAVTVNDVKTLPDVNRRFPLPGGWDESVLMPLAIRRMAAHPDFLSLTTAVRQELAAQAATAHRIMRSSGPNRTAQSMTPTFR